MKSTEQEKWMSRITAWLMGGLFLAGVLTMVDGLSGAGSQSARLSAPAVLLEGLVVTQKGSYLRGDWLARQWAAGQRVDSRTETPSQRAQKVIYSAPCSEPAAGKKA